MFPFRQSCEFSFQVSGNNNIEEEDQIMVDAAATTSNAAAEYKRKRGVDCTAGGGVEDMKKMQHRANEKQRRIVMAGLLTSLRSLLPVEFVKGKRSVSDHIDETKNFIKHLENNIKELQDKRDKLKSSWKEVDANKNNIPCSVAITITNIGLDVQISTGNTHPKFRLSDPLKVLLDQGVTVVCSVSTKRDGVFHHKIQCEVEVGDKFIDIQRLEQRLCEVVSSNRSSSSM